MSIEAPSDQSRTTGAKVVAVFVTILRRKTWRRK
jgi:hypothetical protein